MNRDASWLVRCAWFLARLSVTAWIGAAVLFVAVGVREVTSPDFSHEVKDRLVLLRFPLFYLAGFTLVGLALLSSLILTVQERPRRRRVLGMVGLLSLALAGMTVDYTGTYLPLVRQITPPGQPRTAEFQTLHRRSTRVNTVSLTLCLIAACLANWPRGAQRDSVGETTSA